ncbi:hypothetical protein SAMN05444395_101488 [Flavobacterium fryxellicola]|uniref:Uncharacterized protein n=1 Tax=Flavobacterium fryxellicola TaxID=249352 RepID=A0A168AIL3_9FLAO|nr:hypothetical protein [Flavobacterium fryxellicola]OAB31508.1 hypothetical protein FBFR_01380 [Flavobacterium fryxellicola]SHN53209.1 hypothetical protein SAMN05444395_101488 [Flavobacterium fryxellicola]
MKLTSQQIEIITNYIASREIKWYELQVEFTDHAVSSAEDYFSDETQLNDQQLIDFTGSELRKTGFLLMEEQRIKILRMEHKKKQSKMVVEYFKLPKILLSLLAVFLVYKVSFYFDDDVFYVRLLFGILLGLSVISILNWYRFRKINEKRFLALEAAYVLNNSTIMLCMYAIMMAEIVQEWIGDSPTFILSFCCIWVLGILVQMCGRHLTNMLIFDIKRKYQLI